MAQLVYNGLALPYPMTETFNQEAVMEESGTDFTLTKFEIEQECIVNSDYINNWTHPADAQGAGYSTLLLKRGDDTPATTNPADIMNAVRKALLRPRRSLSFKSGGVELIPTTQGQATGNIVGSVVTGTVDSKNGPQPKYCRIIQLSATTFWMRYKVEAHYWENTDLHPLANGFSVVNKVTPGALLSHRWQETVEINNLNLTRKTREGSYTIRSDNAQGTTADQIRAILLNNQLPYGFTRESCRYSVSKDGLTVTYSIVEKEQFRMPPLPAFEAEGYYHEYLSNNGSKRHVEVQLRLKGQKTDSKILKIPLASSEQDKAQVALYNTALYIIFQKIRSRASHFSAGPGAGRTLTGLTVIEHVGVRYHFYENAIDVLVRGQIPVREGSNPLYALLPDHTLKIGGVKVTIPGFNMDAPGSVDKTAPPYRMRGTGAITMAPAPYFNPDTNQDIPNTGGTILPGQAGTTTEP